MPNRAWKFVRADLRLFNGDERTWEVGVEIRVEPPIVACQRGLHASVKALDVLSFASGERTRIALVEYGGEVVTAPDKISAERMTVIAVASEADTQRELRLFACRCGRKALALIPTPDPRSVAAVDVAERYARGEATEMELAAARDAARAAAWDAARAAARAAARDAAWDAAWAATWAAARDDARDAQETDLAATFARLVGNGGAK